MSLQRYQFLIPRLVNVTFLEKKKKKEMLPYFQMYKLRI